MRILIPLVIPVFSLELKLAGDQSILATKRSPKTPAGIFKSCRAHRQKINYIPTSAESKSFYLSMVSQSIKIKNDLMCNPHKLHV